MRPLSRILVGGKVEASVKGVWKRCRCNVAHSYSDFYAGCSDGVSMHDIILGVRLVRSLEQAQAVGVISLER